MIRKRKRTKEFMDVDDFSLLEKSAPVEKYFSTGCTILDLAIADRLPGGFPAGRISQIWGGESSSKSVLVAEALGSAQRQKGIAFLIDSEATFDMERARRLFGVNIKKLKKRYFSPVEMEKVLTIETMFEDIFPKAIIEAQKILHPCLLGVDSLSAISSSVEQDERIDDNTYGATRAKGLSLGFRKLSWKITNSGLSLLFVDQTRQKLNASWGDKDTRSGGNALGFYASARIKTTKVGNILNKHKQTIGVIVGFKVDKNKIAPPFRTGEFRILFDYGIDDIGTNISFLMKHDKKFMSGKWIKLPGMKKKSDGLDTAIKDVEDNNLEEILIEKVYKVWRKIYQTNDRKLRRRG